MPTPVDRPEPGELVKTVAELVDAVNAGSGGLVLPIQTDGTTTLFQLRDSTIPARTLDVSSHTNNVDDYILWEMRDDLGGAFQFGADTDSGGSTFGVSSMKRIDLAANFSGGTVVISADSALSLQASGAGGAIHLNSDGNTNISANAAGSSVSITADDGNSAVNIDMNGITINSADIGFFGQTPAPRPVVPLTTPTLQNLIDALVSIGLIVQHD